jgi:hydroxymethylglutaryl-CoA lyase
MRRSGSTKKAGASNGDGRLTVEGRISMCASEKFLRRNQNKTLDEQVAYNHRALDLYEQHGIPVARGSIMAAFGCNFEGDVEPGRVVALVDQIFEIAAAHGTHIDVIGLSDTMAWATPGAVKRVVGAVRSRYPQVRISLHLHDTRGMGIANAYAGLEMGVDMFDASVAGLGGCPFAGHKGAAGNVCTEDLVFMCEEMGIETGVDLDRLIECARLAEEVVGHPLPGSVMRGGTLKKLREQSR